MNFNVSEKSRQNQRSAICFRKFPPCLLSSSCCPWGCPVAVCATPRLVLTTKWLLSQLISTVFFFLLLTAMLHASTSTTTQLLEKRFFFFQINCFPSYLLLLGFFLLLRLPPSVQGSLQKRLAIPGPESQSPEAGRGPAGPTSWAQLRAGSIRSPQGVLQAPKQECAGSNLLCFGKTTYWISWFPSQLL